MSRKIGLANKKPMKGGIIISSQSTLEFIQNQIDIIAERFAKSLYNRFATKGVNVLTPKERIVYDYLKDRENEVQAYRASQGLPPLQSSDAFLIATEYALNYDGLAYDFGVKLNEAYADKKDFKVPTLKDILNNLVNNIKKGNVGVSYSEFATSVDPTYDISTSEEKIKKLREKLTDPDSAFDDLEATLNAQLNALNTRLAYSQDPAERREIAEEKRLLALQRGDLRAILKAYGKVEKGNIKFTPRATNKEYITWGMGYGGKKPKATPKTDSIYVRDARQAYPDWGQAL